MSIKVREVIEIQDGDLPEREVIEYIKVKDIEVIEIVDEDKEEDIEEDIEVQEDIEVKEEDNEYKKSESEFWRRYKNRKVPVRNYWSQLLDYFNF